MLVRVVSKLPLRLRSSRQLAREALLHGALQKPSEFGELLRLVRQMKPSVIVEIGSARGGATYAFRAAAPAAMVVSIDIDAEAATIRGDSHDPATRIALKRLLCGQPVDLLFIDGDHSYQGVRDDVEMYSPLVRSGGVIALHDVLEHPAYPAIEVYRYWQEIISVHRYRELVDPAADWGWGQWGGIGLIMV
jgi:predicted O-methyltransferase YrrM